MIQYVCQYLTITYIHSTKNIATNKVVIIHRILHLGPFFSFYKFLFCWVWVHWYFSQEYVCTETLFSCKWSILKSSSILMMIWQKKVTLAVAYLGIWYWRGQNRQNPLKSDKIHKKLQKQAKNNTKWPIFNRQTKLMGVPWQPRHPL